MLALLEPVGDSVVQNDGVEGTLALLDPPASTPVLSSSYPQIRTSLSLPLSPFTSGRELLICAQYFFPRDLR